MLSMHVGQQRVMILVDGRPDKNTALGLNLQSLCM
jgi:hypothetical protein